MAEDKKSVTQVISSNSRITDRKLNDTNYVLWKDFVQRHLSCNDLGTHLTADLPREATAKEKWLKDDDRILNQILNSMEYHIQDLVGHCSTVKELWSYLESLYASKHNLFHVHELLTGLYQAAQKGRPLLQYYSDVNGMFEEMKTLYPLTTDIKQMQEQREEIIVQCVLDGLDFEYEVAHPSFSRAQNFQESCLTYFPGYNKFVKMLERMLLSGNLLP